MKRFNFRLGKLLTIREYKEFEAKLKLAQVLQQKVKLEIENKMIQKSIEESMYSSYKNFKTGEKIDYNVVNFEDEYINGLLKKITINESKKFELDLKLNKLKEEFFEARKERRIIDELKKREFNKYRKEEKKQDIKKLDEIAGQFFARENNI